MYALRVTLYTTLHTNVTKVAPCLLLHTPVLKIGLCIVVHATRFSMTRFFRNI